MRISEVIKRAIEMGSLNGRLTFDQINDLFLGNEAEPEEIEQLMLALRDADIDVVES